MVEVTLVRKEERQDEGIRHGMGLGYRREGRDRREGREDVGFHSTWESMDH